MRECPACKTNDFANRMMVMMVSECGHLLCNNCYENRFARGSYPCPQCGKTLWKRSFWKQMFDDPMLEKENFIRKRLKKIYNLKRDDFPSLREFNDYLERIETIVMNLTCDIDVEKTENEIKRFKQENSALIEKNRRKLDEDQLWVQEMLAEEQKSKQNSKIDFTGTDMEASTRGSSYADNSKGVIHELLKSNLPAETILDRKRKRQIEVEMIEKEEAARLKKSKTEVHQKYSETMSFAPIRISGTPFVYRTPEMPINGPVLPRIENLSRMGYLQHIRPITAAYQAGGFTPEISCMRALFDSRIDLFAF